MVAQAPAESPRRRVAVLGAGAVGCYLGGKLAAAKPSWQITLIGRPRVAEGIMSHGLVIREGSEELVTRPEVRTSAADLPSCDLVILAVRTYDVAGMIDEARRLLGESGLLLAVQNGVGTEEELAAALGRNRVLAGALTVSEVMDEPGIITRTSKSGGVAIATMDGAPVPPWVLDAFSATGLETIAVDDYRSLRWSKLLLNMLAAATSAILDMDIDQLMSDPSVFRIEQLAVREAGRVMDDLGIRAMNLPGYQVRLVRRIMRLSRPLAQRILAPRLINARSGRSPGSRADMGRGKTEIGSFNGAIAAAAAASGFPTPVNAALAELALDLAQHPERRADFRAHPNVLAAYMRDRGISIP